MPDLERVDIGKPSDIGGKAAYLSVQRAVKDAQHKEIDALVTLPVNKATFQQQDPNFKGHTELFAEAFNQSDNLMFMVSEALRVGTVTNHLPLSEVARNISTERIINKVSIMHKSLENDFNIQRPMIAVLGLNPHAGDNGLIGPEEKDIVQPAITELKKRGMRVYGPYPADGIFGSSGYRKFDGIMSMYHDQGLIPFKLISGYEGVNFTAGIPLVRTSPDHGVAYDIAGKGEANPESLRQAIYVAMDVFRNREMNHDLAANALTSTQELRKKIVTTAEDTEED
ncbi:MAG: 4-hydroxythreonine-4-phosphate dehydrogenase PdxA, partial [Bacteroidota bacterium]